MIEDVIHGLILLVAALGAGVLVFTVIDRIRNGD